MRFGYGEGWFNPMEKSPIARLKLDLGRCTTPPGTFEQECFQLATELRRRGALVLCLTGGLDSHVVATTLHRAGVPFSTITCRFEDGLNAEECVRARQLADTLRVPHSFHDLELAKLLRSTEGEHLLREYCCSHAPRVAMLRLFAHVCATGGVPIAAAGEPTLEKVDGLWYYAEPESDLPLAYFCHQHSLNAVPSFFQAKPEVLLSMLLEPEFKALGLGQNRLANAVLTNSNMLKYQLYQRVWGLRPRYKQDHMGPLRALVEPLNAALAGRYDEVVRTRYSTAVLALGGRL